MDCVEAPSAHGGKAQNLARLRELGFPVPPFVVIPAELFRQTSERDRESAYERLLFSLPANARFAVRSSASAEDQARTAMAGLFETHLFVSRRDLPAAIESVARSVFDPRVATYAREKLAIDNIDEFIANLEMSIVVQEMFPAACAGVLFTSDPTGRLHHLVIAAGFGLGEGVVADRVETDTYTYDRLTHRIESRAAHKTRQVTFNESRGAGTQITDVPESLRDARVLSDDDIRRLASLALKIERDFGREQDIEWAIDARGRIAILQSRPITSIPEGRWIVYDNSNITESYPGIVSPLTFSLAQRGYDVNFRRAAERLGISRAFIKKTRPLFAEIISHIEGRVFYNLTNFYQILMLLPGVGRRIIPMFNEMIGADAASASPRRWFREVVPFLGLIARFAIKFPWAYLTLGRSLRKYARAFNETYERYARTDFKAMTIPEIKAVYDDLYDRILGIINRPLLNDLFLMIVFGLTRRAMRRARIPDWERVFGGLFCGLPGLESVKPVRAVVELAARLTAPKSEQTVEFRRALTAYLDEFGDRTLEELKLEVPSFREQPERLVELVRSYAASGTTVAALAAREETLLHDSEAALDRALRGRPLRRFIIRALIARSRRLLHTREKARLDRARYFGILRRLFAAIGDTLATAGVLSDRTDVYQLSIDELWDAALGRMPAAEARSRIQMRRERLSARGDVEPEGRLVLKAAWAGPIPSKRRPSDEGASDILYGQGSSPGIAEAPALVVRNPADARDVAGRILVTEITDPGWVFLMINAAALVVEKGSLLSHTAIIGRELGLPTVIGAANATSFIKTGDIVRVDGATGEVRVVTPRAK
ncbi:MAG: hypothetical protein HYY84_11985 [Deltaproteobacteria bacterium]|nr:hypothetical protein [Deltaproteobacteria bacterium]